VRACALNHLDVWVRGGLPGSSSAAAHSRERLAGVVREVGALVDWVKPATK